MVVDLLSVAVGCGAAAVIAFGAYRAGSLSWSGAVATVVLGTVVFGIGGFAAAVPLTAFFTLSSALSRVGRGERRRRAEEAFEKGGRRDAGQVLANGGVAGVLIIAGALWPSPELFTAYLGSLAAAAADTWGTEIGILGRGPVISVATLRRVEPGRSGGISSLGTLGAFAGALTIAASGIAWSPDPFRALLAATIGGIAGMLVDGLLGATVQERRRCTICARLTERQEHCGQPTMHDGGYPFIGNDAVNALCCATGAAVAYAVG